MNVGVNFEAILPPDINTGAFLAYLSAEARKIQADIVKDFQATVKTWSKKPEFIKKLVVSGTIVMEAFTTDKVYNIISKGSRPREGTFGNKVFVLSGTFSPKTVPGVIGASGGSESGSEFVTAGSLPHPGIKARKFDVAIRDKWKDVVAERFQASLNASTEATGHSIPFGKLGPCKFQKAIGVTSNKARRLP